MRVRSGWVVVTLAASLALVRSDSAASTATDEIQALIDQLDDPRWGMRVLACRAMRQRGNLWLNGPTASRAVDPAADVYVTADEPDKNFGLDPILRLKNDKQDRILIRFDDAEIFSALSLGPVESVSLVFAIADTKNNWSPHGHPLDLHRLTRGFTEAGATGHCPVDTNLLNTAPDCSGDEWDLSPGGENPWHATAAASAFVTSGQQGVVVFDVTAEIDAIASGEPNLGWIVKKSDDTAPGHISFFSGECVEPPRLIFKLTEEPAPPPEPDPTFTSTVEVAADTYIHEGKPDRSFGEDSILRIKKGGHTRVLVHFDSASLQNAIGRQRVTAATLEIAIAHTKKTWPAAGGTVALHRLSQPFSERATWACSNDIDPSPEGTECAASELWDMTAGPPPWEAAATDTALVTDSLEGVLTFDVTADLAAFTLDSPNFGWVLKKADEERPGDIDLASRETATPPRLTLTLVDVESLIVEFFTKVFDPDETSDATVLSALTAARDVPLAPVVEIVETIITRDQGAYSSVTLAVGTRSYAVASAALFDVSDPETSDAVIVLASVLFNDPAPSVRSAAAHGLEILGHPDGVAALESALDTEENGLALRAIEMALANLELKLGTP